MTVRQPVRARVQGQMLDIGDFGHRVRGAFEQDQPGFGLAQGSLDACAILDRQQLVRHAVPCQQVLHEPAGRPVGLDESEDMVALLAKRQCS
jgi:hypothetical protein